MKSPYTQFFLLFFIFFVQGYGQENPPIQSFSPDLYKAASQNWKITQDQNRNIYFANNDGLLQFNGNQWRLHPTPNASILRSVHALDNIIYSGAYMDFGYWTPSVSGNLEYKSLVNELSFSMYEDEQVWSISHYNQFVIFQTLDRLIIFNQLEYTLNSILPRNKILKSFVNNGSIFFQETDGSLYQIQNGQALLMISSSILQGKSLIQIFKSENELILLTERNGFYKWDHQRLIPTLVSTISVLQNRTVYSASKTPDGHFVIGTVSQGVFVFSPNGKLRFQYNRNNGLPNNTVLATFIDMDGNLWGGLDNGICYVNLAAPISLDLDYEGQLGTVYASVLHKGILYLGTNQGLFFKKYPSDDEFTSIPVLEGQVWNLSVVNNQLLCGHNLGPFLIEGASALPMANFLGAWNFKLLDSNWLLVGSYDGVHVFEKVANRWRYKHRINGFDISSRFLEITPSRNLLVSHEYKGVFLIKPNKNITAAEEVVNLENVDISLYSSLASLNEHIYFFSVHGFYSYDDVIQDFVAKPEITKLINPSNFSTAKLVSDEDHSLWLFEKDNLIQLTQNSLSSSFMVTKYPLSANIRNSARGFENIYSVAPNRYLIGTSKGYLIYNTDESMSGAPPAKINLAFARNIKGDTMYLPLNEFVELPPQYNSLRFEFNVPKYDNSNAIEFQYSLKGYSDDWSNWSSISSIDFGNLDYGNYELQLKSKTGGIENTYLSSFEFEIQKPWYFSNTMSVVYLLLLLMLSFVINNRYMTFYKKQKAKLIAINNRKIELASLRNKEEIMRLKNQSLQESIESKNRELAIATMASIKKNQFLNRIIDDLEEAPSNRIISQVLKTIKRNLKNDDDWKFFEEAFNNADKDFLKNIKSAHPKLTHNDLRLCAYLRLNLSSKEIAPLLNISVRSVEIKRYRLRKKLELEHDQSLTDYILAFH